MFRMLRVGGLVLVRSKVKFPLIFYRLFLMYIAYVVLFFFIGLNCLSVLCFAFASLYFLSLVCNVITRSCQNRQANFSMVLHLVSKFDCSLPSDNKPRFSLTVEQGGFFLFSNSSSNSMLSLTPPFEVTTSLVFLLLWIREDSSSFQSRQSNSMLCLER